MNDLELTALLVKHEGLKLKPYRCSEGYLTIGVGHNLDANGISEEIAFLLLREDIEKAKNALSAYSFWESLDKVRQDALTDFMFNVGAGTFAKFKNMIAALEAGDYKQASRELLNSRYAKQVGKRAQTIALMISTGER